MHFREGGGQDRPDPPGAANGSGGEGQPHFQHHQFRNQHHQDQQYHHQDFNVYNRSFGSLTLQYLVDIPFLFILILLRGTHCRTWFFCCKNISFKITNKLQQSLSTERSKKTWPMASVLNSFIGPGISNRFCLVVAAAWWLLATGRTMTQIWSGPPRKCQTNRFRMTSFATWRGAWPKLDTQQGKHFFKQTHWKFTFVEAAFFETSYQLRARRVRKRASVENRVQTRILSFRDQNKFRQDWTRSNRFFGSRSQKKNLAAQR